MTQDERLIFLLRDLLAERKEYEDIPVPDSLSEKRRLLRSLMNVRPPVPVREDFLRVQDAYLVDRLAERGMTRLKDLTPVRPGLYLWAGRYHYAGSGCHRQRGQQPDAGLLRSLSRLHRQRYPHLCRGAAPLECARLMTGQEEEPTGNAKITKAYNLPCRYILHTVGPIISGAVTQANRELLASCYRTCLELAAETGLGSIEFCCISTGEFHFPNELAAEIAIQTVGELQRQTPDKNQGDLQCFQEQRL